MTTVALEIERVLKTIGKNIKQSCFYSGEIVIRENCNANEHLYIYVYYFICSIFNWIGTLPRMIAHGQ